MKPTDILNPTHRFSAPENWDEASHGPCGDLYVRAETSGANNMVELFSCWKPTPAEVAMIVNGCVIQVGICAASQPAMSVVVVEPVPDETPKEETAERTTITINEEAHGL